MAWVECVPNVSEGRRPHVIDGCAKAIRATGVVLLDVSADAAHNRSVYTFAGHATTLGAAVVALAGHVIEAVDLRTHTGEHPRIGALDVVPFVPLAGATMADAIALARSVGEAIARRYDLPVFLYEQAATSPGRRKLEDIRRGGFEGLAAKMRQPLWAPDFGPAAPHPSAGATVVGARRPLIAYNINLATTRVDVARRIAAVIRESSGGLPAVKAMGVALADRGVVQVSMNLTDYATTPMVRVFDAVVEEARHDAVAVIESEIVGLVPEGALSASEAQHIRLFDFGEDRILENVLRKRQG